MSLKPLQAQMPLGQFDVLDSLIGDSIRGGEVVTFGSTAVPPGDKAAADAFDGYVTPNKRAYVVLATGASARPLMLADDGITGYGTLFGTVVGGTVGQVSTGGTILGPHTATGSGKVTCWAAPGLFAVSLDATDPTASTGLQPTNTTLAAGAPLYPDSVTGRLTSTNGANAVTTNLCGHLVEFATNGSLVTTPNTLAGTFNPPDGKLDVTAKVPTYAVIWFAPSA